MQLGKFEIHPIYDGFFGLDGGAMFGVVPKVLWERTNPPDTRNRIKLALRTVLVKTENELTLIDTGIGMVPKELNRIFERFYRVDKSRSRAEGGTGLGLAICRHIAQAHGGKIEVESQINAGTKFTIALPVMKQ